MGYTPQQWPFRKHDKSITIVQGRRTYDIPTTNIDGSHQFWFIFKVYKSHHCLHKHTWFNKHSIRSTNHRTGYIFKCPPEMVKLHLQLKTLTTKWPSDVIQFHIQYQFVSLSTSIVCPSSLDRVGWAYRMIVAKSLLYISIELSVECDVLIHLPMSGWYGATSWC